LARTCCGERREEASDVPAWFQRYLLPGFVFQSIIIAGGYGTGRELVEFFLHFGPVGGLLAMLLPAMLVTSLTAAISFEVARLTRSYDYRSFFRQLLGPGWILYEIGFLSAVLLIMAVIGSASGAFAGETFGIPPAIGTAVLYSAIAFLVFKGTKTIEGVLSVWSFVLYAVYVVLFAWGFLQFGDRITAAFAAGEIESGWALSGTRYAALQISLVPAMLFATSHIVSRREAFVAGALCGPIAMIPGILFFVVMAGHYPEILERPVPVNFVLELLGSRTFQVIFQLVLFGTLIETGTGLIHAFNERIAGVFSGKGRTMPPFARPVIAIGVIVVGSLLSRIGIIRLIRNGYGFMTWYFLAIMILPLLTVGIQLIGRAGRRTVRARASADELRRAQHEEF
jgi:uncharacterized membrane protein YkvI